MSKRNKFAGADDIYLTKKNIAVRKISTWYDKKGKFMMNDVTKYYPKTKRHLDLANSIYGYVRKGR